MPAWTSVQGSKKKSIFSVVSDIHQRHNLIKMGYASDMGRMLSYILKRRQKCKTAYLPPS